MYKACDNCFKNMVGEPLPNPEAVANGFRDQVTMVCPHCGATNSFRLCSSVLDKLRIVVDFTMEDPKTVRVGKSGDVKLFGLHLPR